MVRTSLLDINVLLALAWPSHMHHSDAQTWFHTHRKSGFATCPLTQLGFVRISSNPKFTSESATPQGALMLLDRITELKEHIFWPDSVSCSTALLDCGAIAGHRQLTDLYLIALARSHGGVLVTFDPSVPTHGPVADFVEIL